MHSLRVPKKRLSSILIYAIAFVSFISINYSVAASLEQEMGRQKEQVAISPTSAENTSINLISYAAFNLLFTCVHASGYVTLTAYFVQSVYEVTYKAVIAGTQFIVFNPIFFPGSTTVLPRICLLF